MGNHDHGTHKVIEEVLQPVDGAYIQMVGRLVQQNDLRMAEQCLRQQHLDLVVRLERGHLAVQQIIAQTQTLQQLCRFGFSVPAAQLGKFAFQFGGLFTVRFGEVLLHIEGILFLHNVIQALVAHDDGIQYCVLIILEMVLLHHRHPGVGRDLHRTAGGFQFSREDLQKSGLACTVGSDDAVAVTRNKFEIDMAEQLIGAKAEAQIGNSNQTENSPFLQSYL